MYQLFVYGVSIATATFLILLGPRHYGINETGLIWVKNENINSNNSIRFVLFYIWLLAIYFYNMFVLYKVSFRVKKGLEQVIFF
jgi:hypothetical protein